MWTPKRILILVGGLALFIGGYSVYAYFLGGIDGLPQLDDRYFPDPNDPEITLTYAESGADADKKLAMAFGPDSIELKWKIKLDLPSRGWVFATEFFEPVDGRVKLAPLSAGIFPKNRSSDGKFFEINTVQCKEAYLTLDKPVTNTAELANRKVISVELRGDDKGVIIKNNRQTPNLSDDVVITVTKAPLYYDALANQIWTDGAVQMLDLQTRPDPMRVTAIGLALFLTKDSSAPALSKANDKKTRGKGDAISGVEKLVLKRNVDMFLSIDAKSGFLGNAKGDKKPEPSAVMTASPTPDKTPVRIITPGTFVYKFNEDVATFEGPADPKANPERILVERSHKINETQPPLLDQLWSDYLELHFRRKNVESTGSPREGKGVEKEIDKAYARAAEGKLIDLNIRTDNLEAKGQELVYLAPTETSGPQTVLQGKPLYAKKDGHQIEALELHLIGADKYGKGQKAIAKARPDLPGQIDLFSNNPNQPYPVHATWKDMLIVDKAMENNKLFDLLVMTGEASIVDDEHNQELHGDRLEIMAEPIPPVAGAPPPPKTGTPTTLGGSRQRLYKVDCYENVRAYSPEFIVKLAQILRVRFEEKPVTEDWLPGAGPKSISVPLKRLDTSPTPPPAGGIAPPPAGGTIAAGDKNAPAKVRQPIELEARTVTVTIKRGVTKDELHELIAEGDVHVKQDPKAEEKDTGKQDKGVDIKGNFLQLVHKPLGDVLYVNGDSKKMAAVRLNDLFMTGPKVTLDQEQNTAVIAGDGWMNMPSSTTFEGTKPAKKDARITVYWQKLMTFDGKRASFNGNVQANQDNTWLRCINMEVTLDRHVSFKENKNDGSKDGQGAKVDKIRCEKQVTVVEDLRDASKNYLKFNGLSAVRLDMDNLDEKAVAMGPGQVAILAPGGGELMAIAPKPGQAKPAAPPLPGQGLKLTRIFYDGMIYNKKVNNQRIAHFYQNVRVLHFPANNPKEEMNPDRPPKDGFYMKSDELEVLTQTKPDGKTSQTMKAIANVEFRAENIFGRAQFVTFDESSDLVVLEGKDNTRATLYQYGGEGTRTINARKILYNRKTGAINVVGGGEIGNQ